MALPPVQNEGSVSLCRVFYSTPDEREIAHEI